MNIEDSVRDGNTGLTLRVATNSPVPGDPAHRESHLHTVDAEFARVLGAALSSPSEYVACAVLTLLEIRLRSLKTLARMDEDELKKAISRDPELSALLMEEMSEKLRRAVGRSSVPFGSMGPRSPDVLLGILFGPHGGPFDSHE